MRRLEMKMEVWGPSSARKQREQSLFSIKAPRCIVLAANSASVRSEPL